MVRPAWVEYVAMKRPWLTLYDYGTGGVWSYLLAESPEQIHAKFRDLTVYREPPVWMTDAQRTLIEANSTYDVDTAELEDRTFLARLARR
jgi:hypothetical protein